MLRASLSNFASRRSVVGTPITFKRFARVTSIRFIQSKAAIEKDVLNRYKDKLQSKAAQEGVKDHIELKEKLKDTIDAKKKEMTKIDPLKELEDYEQAVQFSDALKGKKKVLDPIDASQEKAPYKVLDDFVKLDKMKDLGVKEIEYLWRLRFQTKENLLSAIVPRNAWDRIAATAKKNPTFVLPLPKLEAEVDQSAVGEGSGTPMEMHFVQWNFVGPHTTHCIFTSLAEYKLHKEFARPHTSIMFHSELADSKDVILMNGQVETESAITMQESQLLLLNIQRFYGGLADTMSEASKQRLKLVEAFNHGNATFDMSALIELAQSLEN